MEPPNWYESAIWTLGTPLKRLCIGTNAGASPTDSDGSKLTNDIHGYVAGDMATAIAVDCTCLRACLVDASVCPGGDEPASASFVTYIAVNVECTVVLSYEAAVVLT